MLLNLNINNFAVFEKESIYFSKGFNVFTGETGAGKSILIEALYMILGERASRDLIRKGKKSAFIEAVFEIGDNVKLNSFLRDNNLEMEDDFLIISREILENGKSINKVNSRAVPLNTLKIISTYLIDIYDQFGHASLFKKENHIILLDSIIQKEISPLLEQYSLLYKNYNKLTEEVINLEKKLINKDMKIEQLQYELNEIEDAALIENEEENLLKEIKRLSNVQEIKKAMYEIINTLNFNDNSVINNLNQIYSILNKINNYDEALSNYIPKADIFLEELRDFLYDLTGYSDSLEVDEEKLSLIEKRVSLINRLKRKYGYSIEKILEYKNNSYEELELLKGLESKLTALINEKSELNNLLMKAAEKITASRKKAAELLEREILKELSDLNMKNIRFKTELLKKSEFSSDGIDSVEFLISTNVGSDLNSVHKVISGGEASRIMLAFKKIMSDSDSIDTLVFDEIDAGISGKTAQMAGIKMKFISANHQVICVTHSPQIASISKNHFLIEKKVIDNNTYSTINKLSGDTQIKEIARLLSGMKITEKSLSNAIELIEFSNNI